LFDLSGFYYDYSTRFYYDAKSQYYFNSDIQQYMYWDPILSTYKQVEHSGVHQSVETVACVQEPDKPATDQPSPPAPAAEEKPKNAPAKTAAQIAKVSLVVNRHAAMLSIKHEKRIINLISKTTNLTTYLKPWFEVE
jgi:hypothetical protein